MWRQDDDTQSMLRESAAAFLSSQHSPSRFRDCRSSERGYALSFWQEMGDLGWTGILLPEEMGGSALGLLPASTIAEQCGEHLVPEPFVAVSVVAGTILAASDSAAARDLGQQVAKGATVVVLADQDTAEPARPDQASVSIATRGGRLILSGAKAFVPSWSDDVTLLVSATLGGEPCICALPPSSIGATPVTRRMTDGSLTADFSFNDVPLDEQLVLLRGAAARSAIDLAVARGTVGLSAQLEGLSRRLHRMTADYVIQRVQFDRPLADFQAIRHALANLYCDIELSAASWRRAALMLDEGTSRASLAAASVAKARASDTALAVGRAAIQYHGAFGYTEEADVGLYVNAALRWSSWLGNASYHRRQALARHRSDGQVNR